MHIFPDSQSSLARVVGNVMLESFEMLKIADKMIKTLGLPESAAGPQDTIDLPCRVVFP